MLSYASKTLGRSKLPRGRRNIFFYSVPPRGVNTRRRLLALVSSSPINFQQAVTMRRRRKFFLAIYSCVSRRKLELSNLIAKRGESIPFLYCKMLLLSAFVFFLSPSREKEIPLCRWKNYHVFAYPFTKNTPEVRRKDILRVRVHFRDLMTVRTVQPR